ncbi:alpha-hydroxy-acid oxidizing protein [Bradyrhizobium sp. DASA03007]|uniref:alpha-hydroxy-acid oxidizing protein n=1 Tax=unclassified Bradyrhizobium TaxID=2631580 RepID=UPI003F6F9023
MEIPRSTCRICANWHCGTCRTSSPSFVETGGGNGAGLRRNIDGWQQFTLLARSLIKVTPVSTERTMFGRRYSLPFRISAVMGLLVQR